jgi:hypothetical protein
VAATVENRQPAPRVANTACTVTIGDESSVVFAQSGLLSAVALYGTVDASLRVQRLAVPQKSRDRIRANDDNPIVATASVDSDGMCAEPARVALAQRDTVFLTSVENDRCMTLTGEFSVNNIFSVAFNNICADDVLTLSADGLRIHTMDSAFGIVSGYFACDVWPLRKCRYRYFKAQYGAHPRTLLLASQAGVHRVDLRATRIPACSGGGTELDANAELLVDVWRDWGMSSADGGVRVFEPHPRVPFWSIVGTDHSLSIVDDRMPCTPLLAWSLTSSPATPPSLACVASMPSPADITGTACTGHFGDVIVLGSPKDGSLTVHHMLEIGSGFDSGLLKGVSELQSHADCSRGYSLSLNLDVYADDGEEADADVNAAYRDQTKEKYLARTRGIPTPPLIWSDHPLAHVESFPPTQCLTGLALLPHSAVSSFPYHERSRSPQSGVCMTVVQVCANGGSIAQLIGCNAFLDGDHAFETPGVDLRSRADGAESDKNYVEDFAALGDVMEGIDTYLALREAQAVHMMDKDRERLLFDRHNDGIRILGATGRLHAFDALGLRRRISNPHDDDVCEKVVAGVAGIPRPFLRDRPLLYTLRADTEPDAEDAFAQPRYRTRNDRACCGSALGLDSVEQFLSIPRTLCEVAQLTRAGNPHSRTPLDIGVLHTVLEESPYIDFYEVRCPELGDNVPCATVYTTGIDAETSDNALTAPTDGSPFADLLSDLRRSYYGADVFDVELKSQPDDGPGHLLARK